ncbi:hypothetical protein D3C86_1082680 [compost metagenome]
MQPGDQRLVDIDAVPAAGMQRERRFAIFRDADAAETFRILQRLAPQDGGGTAEESAVPFVETALDDAVEHLVFARHRLEGAQVALDWIGIDEEMRRLNQEKPGVLFEISHRLQQEVAGGRVVGVEHGHKLAGRMGKTVIEISGLGMDVAFARQITHVELFAELLQLFVAALRRLRLDNIAGVALLHRAAVVQQPYGETVSRIVHVLGRCQRIGEKFGILVVARHEDIDRRSVIGRTGPRLARRQRHRHDDKAEAQHHDAVHLRQIKQKTGDEVFELVDGRQRARGTPVDITQNDGGAETERDQAPRALPVEALDRCQKDERNRGRHQMRLQADRHRDDGQNAKRHKQPDNDCDGLVHPETFRSRPHPEFRPGNFAICASALPSPLVPTITCILVTLPNRTDKLAREWTPAAPATVAGCFPPARHPSACPPPKVEQAGPANPPMLAMGY